MSSRNPWHGCTKISPDCANCYVYRSNPKYNRDPSIIGKNACFTLPIVRKKNGEYKLQSDDDYVYTCFTSDFFHPVATLPIRWKIIICEPLLGPIDLRKYLAIREKGGIPMVRELVCGGESGSAARICNYNWILSLREQCMEYGVPFCFQQTDANFQKDGRVYRIPRKLQQIQAQKARLIHIDILRFFL